MFIFQQKLKAFFLSVLLIFSFSVASQASIVVLNGLTHENEAQPGETYRGAVEIQNTADTEKSVRIYLRDYLFSHTGETRHDPAGTLERSNAPWITYNPELLNLGPNEKALVEFEVLVPENDSLTGTFWSVIMVEGIIPPDTAKYKQGVTINTAIRYAVQIVTNIGKTGVSDLQFLGLELDQQNENKLLNVLIGNTGERMLRSEVSLELFDEEGNSAGIIKADKRKTYPGTSIKVELPLEGIKPGNYSGMLVADCGNDQIFGTNVSFEL